MQCTCSYSCVHSLPCVEMFCVSSTFPDIWVTLSYLDISVFWWKIYYLYSLPVDVIEDSNKQTRIKHILHKILEKEEIGISVSS